MTERLTGTMDDGGYEPGMTDDEIREAGYTPEHGDIDPNTLSGVKLAQNVLVCAMREPIGPSGPNRMQQVVGGRKVTVDNILHRAHCPSRY